MTDPMFAPRETQQSPFFAAVGLSPRGVSEPIPFPGPLGEKGLAYRLRVLTDDEASSARLDAMAFVRRLITSRDRETPADLYLASDPGLYDDELERQILARALRDPANPNAALADVAELRLWLDAGTRGVLMAAYNDYREERSPLRKVRTPEQLAELVSVLGEASAGSRWLTSCEPALLRSIVRELAARLTTLTRPNCSSSGGPTSA